MKNTRSLSKAKLADSTLQKFSKLALRRRKTVLQREMTDEPGESSSSSSRAGRKGRGKIHPIMLRLFRIGAYTDKTPGLLGEKPMAKATEDGSSVPVEQAEPVETSNPNLSSFPT